MASNGQKLMTAGMGMVTTGLPDLAPDLAPEPLDHLARFGAPDAPALILPDCRLDFADLDRRVGTLAATLEALGLCCGDRVATWLNKGLVACLMPLAAARAGLVHVPVNPALRRGQLAHILADSGARLLIANAERLALLEADDLADATGITPETLIARGETLAPLPPSSAAPDDLAALLYTSGSTGRPKGVMLSHANLMLGARAVARYLDLSPDDRILAVLPLAFDYGQNQLLSAWRAGAAAVPIDYLVAGEVRAAVDRQAITTLAAVPPLWRQLVALDWTGRGGSLRRLTNSGGALTEGLVADLRRTFPTADLYPMYGLTEAFRATYLPPALVGTHPTSIGRAIPYAEILLVGADGQPAEPGAPGELVQAGPLVARGYWRDAVRTAERFRPAPAWSAIGGLAVWSGDQVVCDEDGLLYFLGREDEMIKTQGYRVSPGEVEDVALAVAGVQDAVAHGVADPARGQAIRLVVGGDEEQAERLIAHLKRELPAHMVPTLIEWRASLPRNPNGKLDRAAIRKEGQA